MRNNRFYLPMNIQTDFLVLRKKSFFLLGIRPLNEYKSRIGYFTKEGKVLVLVVQHELIGTFLYRQISYRFKEKMIWDTLKIKFKFNLSSF